MTDLATLLPRPAPGDLATATFIARCLAIAGFWENARFLDGISELLVYQADDSAVRLAGRLHDFRQRSHTFALDVFASDAVVAWFLGIDVKVDIVRAATRVLEGRDRLDESEWEFFVFGEAGLRDDELWPSGMLEILDRRRSP